MARQYQRESIAMLSVRDLANQAFHVCIDLSQDLGNALGPNTAVEPTAFMYVVGCDPKR